MAGTTVVALRGSRHAADPSEFTDEELAGYRSDVRTIARAIERAYDPGQLNYMTFGNTPPRPSDRPAQYDQPAVLFQALGRNMSR